ncbi:MAG TPA: Na/Pi symporter [Flavobacteriales bacterium]|nr:Na/Pi symporter [Flavobacteriales bacterium]HRE97771.1 Na/Pi symporter [Flavobacteriales bacterium]HRJ35377.1 Na/Pi symporter [Flavobacteriales bacterium]HRJ37696.1 Na/Pi symporter [Flavobacteriales bacterium]
MDFFLNIKWMYFLGGLGLFLFGIRLLEDALVQLVGRSFKRFLKRHTGTPVKAVLAGTITTAIIRSSSMVTLLVMSFTGAGIIGLKSGLGIILGANLGTTVTGWIVSAVGFSFDLKALTLPFFALGGLMSMFSKSRLREGGHFLIGFSLMFLGLDFLKDAFAELSGKFDLSGWEGSPKIFFFLAGFGLTAIIQSSSASVAIYLSMLASGVVSLEQAIFLAIGSDLGTTVTALLGTINANAVRRKTGWGQFFMNVFQALLSIALFPLYVWFLQEVMGLHNPLYLLVAFQSLANIVLIIVMIPLLGWFTRFIDKKIKTGEVHLTGFLHEVQASEPFSACVALQNEALKFGKETLRLNESIVAETFQGSVLFEKYDRLKSYENEINQFVVLMQQSQMPEQRSKQLTALSSSIRDFAFCAKEMKDIRHNLEDLLNSSDDEKFRMFHLIRSLQNDYYKAVHAILKDPGTFQHTVNEYLSGMNRDITSKMQEVAMKLISNPKKHPSVNFSSLMNMIREIESSNISMLKAVENYLVSVSLSNSES